MEQLAEVLRPVTLLTFIGCLCFLVSIYMLGRLSGLKSARESHKEDRILHAVTVVNERIDPIKNSLVRIEIAVNRKDPPK